MKISDIIKLTPTNTEKMCYLFLDVMNNNEIFQLEDQREFAQFILDNT